MYEEITYRACATKASWADRALVVKRGLAGNGGQGREFFLARHGQLHTFAAISVFPFERAKELENAVLFLYIFSDKSLMGIMYETPGIYKNIIRLIFGLID